MFCQVFHIHLWEETRKNICNFRKPADFCAAQFFPDIPRHSNSRYCVMMYPRVPSGVTTTVHSLP